MPNPTDARLAEARERLRRLNAGERQRVVYGFEDEEMDDFNYRMLENRYIADLKTSADADLAANPADDGQVVDAQWIADETGNGDTSHLRDMKRFNLGKDDVIRILADACEGPKRWKWSLWIGTVKYIDEPTRRDVRRLLSDLHAGGEGK